MTAFYYKLAADINPKINTMPTPIPPPDSHFITLSQFLTMKQTYSDNQDKILAAGFQGKEILCSSELFNVAAINAVTAVTGCAAVKIYYGMGSDLKIHAMLIAVDKNGVDILPLSATPASVAAGGGGAPIVEEGQRCPPTC